MLAMEEGKCIMATKLEKINSLRTNRVFVFWFRVVAAVGSLLGVFAQLDLHNGRFDATQMLYFTFQTIF